MRGRPSGENRWRLLVGSADSALPAPPLDVFERPARLEQNEDGPGTGARRGRADAVAAEPRFGPTLQPIVPAHPPNPETPPAGHRGVDRRDLDLQQRCRGLGSRLAPP